MKPYIFATRMKIAWKYLSMDLTKLGILHTFFVKKN